MNFIIYDNQQDAIDRENEITVACNFNDGVTTHYADIIQHPTIQKWAMVISPAYLVYFTSDEINSAIPLSYDWFPTENKNVP